MRRALRAALAAQIALLSASLPGDALTPGQLPILFGPPGWVRPGASDDMDFANGRYYGLTPGQLTNTRASAETCLDASGNLYQVGAGQNCIAPGVGIGAWEARTNGIRNNTMVGAVVGTPRTISGITGLSRSASPNAVLLCSTCNASPGDLITISGASVSTYNGAWAVTASTANTSITFATATSATDSAIGESVSAISPGTLPTNWQITGNGTGFGLVVAVVGLPTIQGAQAISLQFAGALTFSGAFTNILAENQQQITATYGQTWTSSEFEYVSAGSLSNISLVLATQSRNSAGGGAGDLCGTAALTNMSPTRVQIQCTFLANTTAYANNLVINMNFTAAATTNVTVTITAPQLELNPNIPAAVASAVTAASGSGGTNGTAVYSVSGGTCTTAPTLNVTWASGVLTVNSVANAGSCSVLPPSPATLAYVSGTASGWTGATVTLTPKDNSAQAFATPPILTSGSAATRAADLITSAGPSFCPNFSASVAFTPSAPTGYPVSQWAVGLGSGSNKGNLERILASGQMATQVISGGVQTSYGAGSVLAAGSLGKIGLSNAAGAQLESNNGSTVTPTTGASPTGMIGFQLGRNNGNFQANGYIGRLTLWPCTALSQTALNQATH